MAGEAPAVRLGIAALLGHDPQNNRDTKRVLANKVGQLQVGPSFGKVELVRDSQGRVSQIRLHFTLDGEEKIGTMTITRNAQGRVTEISELTLT